MGNACRVKEEVNVVSVFSKLMNRNLHSLGSLLLLEILTLISCVFVVAVVLLFLSFFLI